ncbi:MAG: hypothetical protein HQM11_15830 [SAR324 cluster bacterium]|nr:hypothetical protein [SAR324 cluster bacterium]
MHKVDESWLEQLSDDEKTWLAIAMAGLIVSDGVVDASELEYLGSTIAFVKNPDTIKQIIQLVRDRRLPPMKNLNVSGLLAYQMLKTLSVVAVVDKKFSRNEAEFLKIAGNRLGLDPPFIEEVLKLAKIQVQFLREDARLNEIASHIVRQ